MKIMTNHWGWSPRGVLTWIRYWAWPLDVWGVERTENRPAVYRDGQRLQVFERRVKVGPICFAWGGHTWGYVNGKDVAYSADGKRVLKYPHGRFEHWKNQRRRARQGGLL